jgi:hypothetical protein
MPPEAKGNLINRSTLKGLKDSLLLVHGSFLLFPRDEAIGIAVHLTVARFQLAVQEVFTPTSGPSPKNWGRGVKLMGCFSGELRSKNNPVTLFPLPSGKGGQGGWG